MTLDDVVRQLASLARPVLDLVERYPDARWVLAAIAWLFVVHRGFGRGEGLKRRGLSHLYDLLVVIAGIALVWFFNASR